MSQPDMGSIFPIKKSMKYSGHRKLLCELSKLSKLNAFILLGYQTNTDASILVYKSRPERSGFNMYAEYTQPQLTFLGLLPWIFQTLNSIRSKFLKYQRFTPLGCKYIEINKFECVAKIYYLCLSCNLFSLALGLKMSCIVLDMR